MRLGVAICAVAAVGVIAWGTAAEYRGEDDGPAPPQVQAFADCLSAAGVAKAETSNDAYYGSEGRVFVPGGEVFVFASQQAAEGSIPQIEADNASPQLVPGTVPVVGVPDASGLFPLAESSRCAYGG